MPDLRHPSRFPVGFARNSLLARRDRRFARRVARRHSAATISSAGARDWLTIANGRCVNRPRPIAPALDGRPATGNPFSATRRIGVGLMPFPLVLGDDGLESF